MATSAEPLIGRAPRDRFFLNTSIGMALVVVIAFSLQLGMGRSSFGAPPVVHVHAVIFMGWVAIYVAQNALAGPVRSGSTGASAGSRRVGRWRWW